MKQPEEKTNPAKHQGLWIALTLTAAFLISANHRPAFDIFYHLRVGLDVLAQRSLHTIDTFSYTGKGTPSENWEWGFGLVLIAYRNLVGLKWLHLLTGFFGALAALFIYLAAKNEKLSPRICALIAVWFAMVVKFRMLARPHLITIWLCALFLWLFEKNRKSPSMKTPILVAAFMSFWSTMHQGSIYGLLIVLCYVGEAMLPALLPAWFSRRIGLGVANKKQITITVLSLAGGLAAYFAMPLASERFGFVIGILTGKEFHVYDLVEYRPLNPAEFPLLAALFIAAVALALADYKHPRPALLVWTAGFLPMTLKHNRLGVVLAVGLCGLIMHHGANIAAKKNRAFKKLTGWPVGIPVAGVIVYCALVVNTVWFSRALLKPMEYSGTFPEKALAFADSRGLSGPLYNSYKFGNYLIYNFDPRRPVFYDAREWPFRKLYRELRDKSSGQIADQYDFAWALVANNELSHDLRTFQVRKVLLDTKKWRTVYFDRVASVLVRLDGPNGDLGARQGFQAIRPWLTGFEYLKNQFNDPMVKALIQQELALSETICPGPIRTMWEASYYGLDGDMDKAILTLKQAAVQNPDNVVVQNKLGEMLVRAGRADEGEKVFKHVLWLDSKKTTAMTNLGTIYLQQGRLGKAIRYFKKALAIEPDQAQALFNLGLAYEDAGKPKKAKKMYDKIRQLTGQKALKAQAAQRAAALP